jgi:hypothetical protein
MEEGVPPKRCARRKTGESNKQTTAIRRILIFW